MESEKMIKEKLENLKKYMYSELNALKAHIYDDHLQDLGEVFGNSSKEASCSIITNKHKRTGQRRILKRVKYAKPKVFRKPTPFTHGSSFKCTN